MERLAESDVFEKEWLVEILKELIEALFICISNEKEIGDTKEENLTAENSLTYKQVLDFFFLYFLVQLMEGNQAWMCT